MTTQAIIVPLVLLAAAAVTVFGGRWAFRAGRRQVARARLAMEQDVERERARRDLPSA